MRKGPSEHAKEFSIGKQKVGNDGNVWKIIQTKHGVKRWKKIQGTRRRGRRGTRRRSRVRRSRVRRRSGTRRRQRVEVTRPTVRQQKGYFVHDNRGRPFKVVIDGKKVTVYRNQGTEDGRLVGSFSKVKKIFVGKSIPGDDFDGERQRGTFKVKDGINTFLLHLKGRRYAFIGPWIYEFDVAKDDHIEQYFSMIGRNDVPYPVALGEKNVYFLISKGSNGYLPRTYFSGFPETYRWGIDAYHRLWGSGDNEGLAKKAKRIPNIKVIQKRIW